MSKKFRINIKCNQVVFYDQRIDVTQEQLDQLQKAGKLSISHFSDMETFNVIANSLNGSDIADTEKEFKDLEVEFLREVPCLVFNRKPFLTEKFFESRDELLGLFYDLLKNDECTDEFEMYTGGAFLCWTVKIDQCKDILATMINDFEAYCSMSNDQYDTGTDPNILNLCLLNAEHMDFFGHEHEIYWDNDKDFFVFKSEYNAYNSGN